MIYTIVFETEIVDNLMTMVKFYDKNKILYIFIKLALSYPRWVLRSDHCRTTHSELMSLDASFYHGTMSYYLFYNEFPCCVTIQIVNIFLFSIKRVIQYKKIALSLRRYLILDWNNTQVVTTQYFKYFSTFYSRWWTLSSTSLYFKVMI